MAETSSINRSLLNEDGWGERKNGPSKENMGKFMERKDTRERLIS